MQDRHFIKKSLKINVYFLKKSIMKRLLLIVFGFTNIANAQIISTYAGNGTAGYSGDGSAATAASLDGPGGIAFDGSGNIFVSDYNNHTIRKISPSGIITTIAGNGFSGFSGDGGPATNAQLSNPAKIALDSIGNLYVADFSNNRIRRISVSGIITTVAGNGVGGYNGDGIAATSAKLHNPSGVFLDHTGSIFIADYSNNRIRKVSASGIITTVAGNGIAGSLGDGGMATAAEINNPWGASVDATGNIYIADAANNKIRKVVVSGIINTFAGTGIPGFSGDGALATAAKLDNPGGVIFDSLGNIYIDDQFNGRVRKVAATGIISTIAGNGIAGYGGDGGPATAAEINLSNEIGLDHYDNLFICDNSNHRVRKISECSIGAITHQPANDTVLVTNTAKYWVSTTMLAPSYQWQENSGSGFVNLTNVLPYSGVNSDTLEIHNVIMLFNATHYRCVISNEISCTDTSAAAILIVQDKTGLQQQLLNDMVSIYPNPSHNYIIVKLPYQNGTGNIQLLNEIGQVISSQIINENITNVSLEKLACGMYIVRIQYDAQIIFRKIIKL